MYQLKKLKLYSKVVHYFDPFYLVIVSSQPLVFQRNALYVLVCLLSKFSLSFSLARRSHILAFIEAIELAQIGNIKESIKKIEWIFKDEINPKKDALAFLIKILEDYDDYNNKPLITFYNYVQRLLDKKVAKVSSGRPKLFYNSNLYKEIAVCKGLVDDSSNHITIHKAKGNEFENVFIVDGKSVLDLLLNPDLDNEEEHRIFYVALSRAKKRLFLNLKSYLLLTKKKLKRNIPLLVLKG